MHPDQPTPTFLRSIRAVLRDRSVFVACLFAIGILAGCTPPPNYERIANDRITAFFSRDIPVNDFTINSPWRETFKAENIKKRAPLALENLELLEVRLPGSPNGLEAAFRLTFQVKEPFQLKDVAFPAGKYTAAGNMLFTETTRGIVIRDVNFAVVADNGKIAGANYLPWKAIK